jgi:hypothetical protein
MNNWKKTKKILNDNDIETFENLPDNVLSYLKNNIQRNKKFLNNKNLAGHIKEEYIYTNRQKEIDEFFVKKIFESKLLINYLKNLRFLTNDVPIVLDKLWCNFMKKYEFNPLHTHSGIFSFIVFLKIPYNLDDENNIFPEVGGENCTSRLQFVKMSSNNLTLNYITVNVDKSFENKIIMFPSNFSHQVYPFYTSNDERVTVSGNFRFLT